MGEREEPEAGAPPEQREWYLDEGALVDHFQVLRPLGRGGMAEVYLARDTQLSRKVALKVVSPKALGSAEAVRRFLFEAQTTARFNSQHIVTVHAVGQHGGRPYVALEYLQGQTLREHMKGQRVPVQEAIRIGLAIADALRVAHESRVLHRDLKPENVMLTTDDQIRVLDFGLARVFRRGDQPGEDPPLPISVPVPETHQSYELFESMGLNPRGTPAYMAPEQWEEKETTGATDIWALGVMLHEMLTGERPFGELTVFKLALQVCGDDAPSVEEANPAVPAALSGLIRRSMHKEPERRPTAGEMVQQLRALLVEDLSTISSDSLVQTGGLLRAAMQKQKATDRTRRGAGPGRGILWAVAGLAVIGGLAALYLWSQQREDTHLAAGIANQRDLVLAARHDRPAVRPDIRAAADPDAGTARTEAADQSRSPTRPPGNRRPPRKKPATRPKPARGTGWLTVDARPWAEVYLDGKRLDVTPIFRRKVPAGRHRLELRNPDHNLVRRVTILIPRDGEIRRTFVLSSMPEKPSPGE